ncbi:hypothetical protein [Geothrix sp. PMB-07]|uniref:hypothetical protein n=1 Tax=Geothrix sp. PMB-07 TaxID=3068640 RepID=UPI002740CC3A|nr:hypothetical protein [Geothrix sp. PMB-07]WLT31914.1 hypothetical protein Q9293_01015 [Geothrix sp. PMB-07]
MPLRWFLFLPPALAVGWFGTRTALHIRSSRGSRGDSFTMLVLCWSPLVAWILAYLLSLSRSLS